MKKVIHTFLALGAMSMAGVAAVPANAAYGRAGVVNNNAYYSVERLWTAPVGYSWAETYLNFSIRPRTNSYVDWANTTHCIYDVKVQLSNGTTQWFKDVNVCRGDNIIIN